MLLIVGQLAGMVAQQNSGLRMYRRYTMTVNTLWAVGPTHLPIQQVPVGFSAQSYSGLQVLTYFHILLRLRMSGAIRLLPHMAS